MTVSCTESAYVQITCTNGHVLAIRPLQVHPHQFCHKVEHIYLQKIPAYLLTHTIYLLRGIAKYIADRMHKNRDIWICIAIWNIGGVYSGKRGDSIVRWTGGGRGKGTGSRQYIHTHHAHTHIAMSHNIRYVPLYIAHTYCICVYIAHTYICNYE
jgi:hypothetical protein